MMWSFASWLKLKNKINGLQQVVWTLVDGEPGVFYEVWNGDGFAAPHGPVDEIFNVPGGLWGTADHVNGAPNYTGIHPDFIFNDAQLIGDSVIARDVDQIRVWGWKKIPADGFIRDANGNSGETGRVYCGVADGCWNNRIRLISDQTTNTTGADRGILDPYPVVAGAFPMLVQLSDVSFFQGFQLQWSANGEDGWINLGATAACQTPAKWTPRLEPCDYIPVDGETLLPPPQCCPTPGLL